MRYLLTATVAIGLSLCGAITARAEFQIQEAGIEKGEVEIEYRGAYHWGVPQGTATNENANDLVQSHEVELSYGLTNWWLLEFTPSFEQPLGKDLQTSGFSLETEFALIKREGDGVAVSFQGGYQWAVQRGEPDELAFGPIVELAKGPFILTLNPLFTKQVGNDADQEGLGFEYGWRSEYDFSKRWGVGVEMFGTIESLTDSGSFNDQVHSIGPTLFFHPGGGTGEEAKEEQNEAKNGGPSNLELSLNVGVQFGLTDATSDTALKFQGSLAF